MKVKGPKMGSTREQEDESSHPARAIKQTSPTKGKSPFQDGLLPGCASLINKVAMSPPRYVARSYNRSRCCPTSIRPRELVLSTSTPSVAPSFSVANNINNTYIGNMEASQYYCIAKWCILY
jgi:hypothetical protein